MSLPKGNLLFVVIARISRVPPRPSIVRGVAARTKALACEISRANTLSATLRGRIPWSDRGRERDTFSREKLLSNAITICYGAHTLRGLTTIGTMCAPCVRVYMVSTRREENREAKGNRGDRSISTTRGNWTEDERIN